MFEHALWGIFQTTADGRYVRANPALARIYGYASVPSLLSGLTDIGRQLSTLADAYDVKLPRELVLIGKQFLYVERYMKLLAPKWQMMSDPQFSGYFANFMVEVSREHQSDVEV